VKGTFDFDDGTAQGWRIAGLYEGGALIPIPGAFDDVPAPWMDTLDAPAAPPGLDPAGNGIGAIALGTSSPMLYPVGSETVWAWHFNSPDLDSFAEWQTASTVRIRVSNLMTTELSTSENWIEFVAVVDDGSGTLRYFSDFVFHPIPPNVPPAARTWSTFTFSIAAPSLPGIVRRLQLRVFGEHDLYQGFIALDDVTPMYCGDGAVDTGEQCDSGAANGTPTSCCSATCTLKPAGTVCRPALDPCDVVEACLGEGPDCPSDRKAPDDTSCSDGDACNGAETCESGTCTPGTALECDDRNPCTADSCDAGTGCVHTRLDDCIPCGEGVGCDDGNPCTDDACVAGACRHVNDDANPCEDGNVCNGAEACSAGRCSAGVALECSDGNVCTIDSCDAREGCRHQAVPDGAPCDDGDACTRTDSCQAATCTGADPVVCTAPDPCTDAGSCDPVAGTCAAPTARADGTTCDDGNPTTSTDVCQAGRCAGVSLSAVAPETVLLPREASAQQVPVVVTLDDTTGATPASVEAQGFADASTSTGLATAALPQRAGGCPRVAPSPKEPGLVPVTREVTKTFRGAKRRITLKLKLNSLGRCLLRTRRVLAVEVRVTLTDRAGRTVLQHLRSLVRRGR
jgi:hypothetical protein